MIAAGTTKNGGTQLVGKRSWPDALRPTDRRGSGRQESCGIAVWSASTVTGQRMAVGAMRAQASTAGASQGPSHAIGADGVVAVSLDYGAMTDVAMPQFRS